MRRHVRTTCKIAPNERNGEEGKEKLYDHIAAQEEPEPPEPSEIETLRAEVSELRDMLYQLQAANNVQQSG